MQNYLDIINSQEITALSSVFKLMLSMLLGAIVGFERKSKGQNAGIRTFALISMGATMAMILSVYVLQEYYGGDPGRMAAQVLWPGVYTTRRHRPPLSIISWFFTE